jgi:hypothetical protein
MSASVVAKYRSRSSASCGEANLANDNHVCWRCLLSDRINKLLVGPGGAIPECLQPLAQAIVGMPRPNSGVEELSRPVDPRSTQRASLRTRAGWRAGGRRDDRARNARQGVLGRSAHRCARVDSSRQFAGQSSERNDLTARETSDIYRDRHKSEQDKHTCCSRRHRSKYTCRKYICYKYETQTPCRRTRLSHHTTPAHSTTAPPMPTTTSAGSLTVVSVRGAVEAITSPTSRQ